MHLRTLFFSALACACTASAAAIERRTFPADFDDPSIQPLVRYISNIAQIRQAIPPIPKMVKEACESTHAPSISDLKLNGLPPPSPGLTVWHVAIGRGIQNYTCGANSSVAPTPIGAVAVLYNVTCQASLFPQSIDLMPPYAVHMSNPSDTSATIPGFSPFDIPSGHHYFTDATTPTFNLNEGSTNYGIDFAKKTANVTAPANSASGPDGSMAVSWLQLKVENPLLPPLYLAAADKVGDVQEIYRVNTAGGSAPPTCAGIESRTVSYQYAAEYWFLH